MLAAKLDPYGYNRFDPPVLPVTDSQIIPVRPLSQPPPPPVDALGAEPPPIPPMFPERPAAPGLTSDDLMAVRPRWSVAMATLTTAMRSALNRTRDQLAPRWQRLQETYRSRSAALAPWLRHARLRCSMGWLMAMGWVVNQLARLPKLRIERARYERVAPTPGPVAPRAGLATRPPIPADLERLRHLEQRLRALIAQLDMQRIAGTDNTPNEAGAIAIPHAPFEVAEAQGRIVGLVEADA